MRRTIGLHAVLVGALLSACSTGTSAPAADQGAGQASASSHSESSHAAAGDGESTPADASAAGSGAESAAPGSPTEAALRLEALVGQHSILASDMMRARVRADSDLAQAADAALRKNTKAMGSMLQPSIRAPARKQFEKMWAEHIAALFIYSRGLATGDDAVLEDARHELVEYEDELAEFFADESKGRWGRSAATAALRRHSEHLVQAADAYAAKRYEAAAKLYRHSYSQTFDLGTSIARAMLPPSVAKALDRPSLRLRSALTKLLGEHVSLVTAAMRSSVGDSADFAAMGAAVNANTLGLTAAIDSLFGAAAAKGFQSRWADHVDQLLAYTTAVVNGDATGRERARLGLGRFEKSFAGFLNTATQNRLGQAALAQTFRVHDRMLLEEIDAFAAKDFQQAHDLSYRAYEDMFTVSGQLARAIGATIARRLPRGGSQTGGGSMAGPVEGR